MAERDPVARAAPVAKARLAKAPSATAKKSKSALGQRWTRPFLAALADTSNVAAAARKAKIDPSTAYHRRRIDAEFNREWQVALCEGYDNLEMELLHRLRTGELKPAAGAAKRAGRSFDNATAFRLLVVHRESAARERALRDHVSAAEIRSVIDRKIEDLRQRVAAAKSARDGSGAASASTTLTALPAPANPANNRV
ncbi:hypothetical protein [Novosphingobium sp. FKTRR1]|uniref:hypothetical protein n=1 Tax=Novosphingobium sp. FKTRR1 TaxID=2879118 RepID=UPI001CEFB946|nr:hypothetical protein [Novosphingobium sp. FKTRR1]